MGSLKQCSKLLHTEAASIWRPCCSKNDLLMLQLSRYLLFRNLTLKHHPNVNLRLAQQILKQGSGQARSCIEIFRQKRSNFAKLNKATLKKNSKKLKNLKILKIAKRGSEAFQKILHNAKPPLPKKAVGKLEVEKRSIKPIVSFLDYRRNSHKLSTYAEKKQSFHSIFKASFQRKPSAINDLRSDLGSRNRMNATSVTQTASRINFLPKQKPLNKRKEEKKKLITKLLSKNSSNIDPNSIIFQIPNSVILKSKQWSLANDKLAEINQTVISECNLLLCSKSNGYNRQGLDKAIKTYIERDLIQKLKKNTWNWIVANKPEYVNFMANNYEKFKKWLINIKVKQTSSLKLHLNGQILTEKREINEEELTFSKKTFSRMMDNFGLGKDKETLE
ncbi:unnamed protein product [Moneuplotes crassus]|uniref:Uncharacterized protein n=1 Tax=Euplotes crassus TaxID=5936 RepID=A0AAD1UAB9_EUPCR|nr:unnamed protein product [Moneuplotes crassus]